MLLKEIKLFEVDREALGGALGQLGWNLRTAGTRDSKDVDQSVVPLIEKYVAVFDTPTINTGDLKSTLRDEEGYDKAISALRTLVENTDGISLDFLTDLSKLTDLASKMGVRDEQAVMRKFAVDYIPIDTKGEQLIDSDAKVKTKVANGLASHKADIVRTVTKATQAQTFTEAKVQEIKKDLTDGTPFDEIDTKIGAFIAMMARLRTNAIHLAVTVEKLKTPRT